LGMEASPSVIIMFSGYSSSVDLGDLGSSSLDSNYRNRIDDDTATSKCS
jgi:hypothetical protein